MRSRSALVVIALVAATAGASAAPTLPRMGALAQLLALEDGRRVDFPDFEALARHPDPAVRVRVARALATTADARVVPFLERLAKDGTAVVRAAAAESAGRLAGREPRLDDPKAARRVAALLSRLLGDSSPEVRRAAAWGLGGSNLTTAAPPLLARLPKEKDAGVRASILGELWRMPGAAWISPATSALADRDPGVRFAAAWSLARNAKPDALPGLRRAAGDADPLVILAALSAAKRGLGPDLADELVRAAAGTDARVRAAAFEGLTAAAEKSTTVRLPDDLQRALAMAISNADPTNVHERVAAIRLAGVARCCPEALRAAFSGGEAWIAGESLVALARRGDGEIWVTVQEWLQGSELRRRLAAVRALRFAPGAATKLGALLSDHETQVKLAAIEEVSGLGAAPNDAQLVAALDDSDPAVRAAAVEALVKRKALPPPARLLALLDRETGSVLPDVAVALIGAVAEGPGLEPEVRQTLERLSRGNDAVVARASWVALRKHDAKEWQPQVATSHDDAYYRAVLEWAAKPRFFEIVTQRGTMQVALDTETAPLSCYRLAKLAEEKFFDGLTMHRIVPNFVVQGGDPRGDGWGGPGFALRDELTTEPYVAGTVGLAHSGPDTAGSQFFVTLTPQPHLVGRYPVIGHVVNGLDVASRLRPADKILRVKSVEGQLGAYFPIWYGPLDPARLDAGIDGWKKEREAYRPKAEVIEKLTSAKVRYDITIAMGTWCPDSREQIPRLQAVLASLGARSPFSAPVLVGIDRTKWANPKEYRFGAVELVPTIVVTTGGQEIGRIVETPSSGSIEEDLVRILSTVEGWESPPHG